MPTCLLIIDVQKGFINEHTARIPARVMELQGKFSLTLASKFVNAEGSAYRRLMDWQAMGEEDPDGALAFTPLPTTTIFTKTGYSCVTPRLIEILKEAGLHEVTLCGINTECCVLKTATDLFEAGLRPIVLSTACASYAGTAMHEAGLMVLRRLIGNRQVV